MSWKCPKCGRTFSQTNQSHFCKEAPQTIDDYIESQPESVRGALHQIRDAIRTELPLAEERISWAMPTFRGQVDIIHFAAQKHHVGLYPGEEAVAFFADRLSAYHSSKGAIQFLYENPLPLALIREIARWCWDNGNYHRRREPHGKKPQDAE